VGVVKSGGRKWWRGLTQNQVVATSCWFESGQGHQSNQQVAARLTVWTGSPGQRGTPMEPPGLFSVSSLKVVAVRRFTIGNVGKTTPEAARRGENGPAVTS